VIGHELPVVSVDAALRVVRALGAHRYVAGRMHLVHALALEGAEGEGGAWASAILADRTVDPSSRDERLFRSCTEAEVCAVLRRFWEPGERGDAARATLRAQLARLELPLPEAQPFDEDAEEDMHPVLVDCGWELVPLRELDPVQHRGLIEYYDEPIFLEAARFEEENAVPPRVHLQELSAIGPKELLFGATAGVLSSPLVVWCEGDATYHEYLLRGVLRAAKIELSEDRR
jgi:hypothetical protein